MLDFGYIKLVYKGCDATTYPGIFNKNRLLQSWAERYRHPVPTVVEEDPTLPDLNASQIQAIATMIGERLSLIQGPPGTGKTKTIVEAIKLLKATFRVPDIILLCTYTNVAVDNLVEGLVKNGLKPLRVGDSSQEGYEEYNLEYHINKHPRKKHYDDLINERDRLNLRIRPLERRLKRLMEKGIQKGHPSIGR